jgi:hypothetical protein
MAEEECSCDGPAEKNGYRIEEKSVIRITVPEEIE